MTPCLWRHSCNWRCENTFISTTLHSDLMVPVYSWLKYKPHTNGMFHSFPYWILCFYCRFQHKSYKLHFVRKRCTSLSDDTTIVNPFDITDVESSFSFHDKLKLHKCDLPVCWDWLQLMWSWPKGIYLNIDLSQLRTSTLLGSWENEILNLPI